MTVSDSCFDTHDLKKLKSAASVLVLPVFPRLLPPMYTNEQESAVLVSNSSPLSVPVFFSCCCCCDVFFFFCADESFTIPLVSSSVDSAVV